MISRKKQIVEIAIVAVVTIFIVVTFAIYGYGSSIGGDEYFSIGFANNTEDYLFVTRGAIDIYGTDGWLDGSFLHDWLSVQPGEGFAIMPIHRNVRHDVHPPLYFMLLNFISSLFVDQVTLFPGNLINICAVIVICIFLYLISRKIFDNRYLAYVPVLFWTTTNGAYLSMTYIRMYASLCALCLICLYLHMELLEKEKLTKYWYVLLGICTTIGTLTHYYFYIWLLVIFLVTVIVCLYQKQIRKLLAYGMSLLIGWVVSLMAYPYVFKHLLFSERGTQVQDNFANVDWEYYKDFLCRFHYTINRDVYSEYFDEIFHCFLVLVLLSVVALLIYNLGNIKNKNGIKLRGKFFLTEHGAFHFVVVAIEALCYFLILFKISYSSNWIYISPVFGLLAILTVGTFGFVLQNIIPKYYAYLLVAFCGFSMIFCSISRMKCSIEDHERTKEKHEKIIQYSEDCDALFFYDDWNNLYGNQILELMEFDQIKAIPVEEMETTDYDSELETREKKNDLVLYIETDVEEYNNKIKAVAEKLGNEATLIYEDDYAVYHVALN